MRLSIVISVLLGGNTNIVSSFHIRATVPPATATATRALILAATGNNDDPTSSEEYLSNLWNELKRTDRDIVVQEKVNEGTTETNDEMLTKRLVEEMLDTALEHVKTKERLEARHAKEAHEAFEKAKQEEQVLHEYIEEEQLHDVPMDSFISERLHAAEEAELQAMKEEDDSIRTSQELRNSESNIKATLEALKRLEP